MNSNSGPSFQAWNKKIHIYLGLYLLLSTWIFAASGLLLNHSSWQFAEFWANRKEANVERPIEPPSDGDDLVRARQLMGQLGVEGEVEWVQANSKAGSFTFRVERPGRVLEIKADLANRKAAMHEIRFNTWGVLRTLHTFTGVRGGGARVERDWALTWLWSVSMDALAVGLIVLAGTSLVMAWARQERRRSSAVALSLGVLVGGLFAFGLRLL